VTDSLILTAGAHGFGAAQHPTTQLLLGALDGLAPQLLPRRVCDMGCGSGILALRAHQLWPNAAIIGADISEEAVATTRYNIEGNDAESAVSIVRSDGFLHPTLIQNAPYDLILMNILAEPIIGMISDAYRYLDAGGILLLSGLLFWQQEPIIEAAEGLGLELSHRFRDGDWVAHLWQKPEDLP
jgi:ribosomal protein L11 methyltransferase